MELLTLIFLCIKDIYAWIIDTSKTLLKFLSFVENKSISLTNLLMYVVIYKVFTTPVLSVADLVLLLGALTSYIHRRTLKSKVLNEKKEDDEV